MNKLALLVKNYKMTSVFLVAKKLNFLTPTLKL